MATRLEFVRLFSFLFFSLPSAPSSVAAALVRSHYMISNIDTELWFGRIRTSLEDDN